MNRRGNIGVLLTPFIAFILIVMALFNMITFNGNLSDERANLNILALKSDKNHNLIERNLKEITLISIQNSRNSADFVLAFNESLKRLASEKRTSETTNNLYAKIALGEYTIKETALGYELIVPDIFEDYSVSNNELRYYYSIAVLFDKDRLISINIIAEQIL